MEYGTNPDQTVGEVCAFPSCSRQGLRSAKSISNLAPPEHQCRMRRAFGDDEMVDRLESHQPPHHSFQTPHWFVLPPYIALLASYSQACYAGPPHPPQEMGWSSLGDDHDLPLLSLPSSPPPPSSATTPTTPSGETDQRRKPLTGSGSDSDGRSGRGGSDPRVERAV